jgi:3',5'-cyclic-AMP phosphodiesterase
MRGLVMSPGLTVVQLSDPHIGALWGGVDPVDRLAATVGAVRAMRPEPDAVVVSGDLADNAQDTEYEQLRELLGVIAAPVHVLPGNHDEREALRRHFGLPGTGAEPIQYAVDLDGLRLLVLDTKREGHDAGELDASRIEWLDAELASSDAPTVIAMHHPPLLTGVPAMDAIGLPGVDLQALAAVVERHAHVRRLVGGHVHRAVSGELAWRPVLAGPSTYVQLRMDFESTALSFTGDPPGFAVHLSMDGEVVSHVQAVG